jgi:hypothetical protein
MDTKISTYVEMPESLHLALTMYLDNHPEWSSDAAIVQALSAWLGQGMA